MASHPEQSRLSVRRRLLTIISESLWIILQAVLVALKLAGIINWSWGWVLTPLWIVIAASVPAAGLIVSTIGQNRGGPERQFERLSAQLRRESMRRMALTPGPPEDVDLTSWRRGRPPTADS